MISRQTKRSVRTRHSDFARSSSLPNLANKYKEYNKLRGKVTAQVAPQTPSKRTTSRHSPRNVERTPKGPPKPILLTPLKRKREEELVSEAIPQSPGFSSPQGPNVIGPTPQRDGIVLGLFDMLPAGTPSKRRAVLADVELNVLQTPSRKTQDAASETSLESRGRGERTPLSVGKRFMLNQFVTPKKRELEEEGTPSSTFRGLATPAFLRRGNVLGAINETDETTPRPAPWKRRGLGRSLSAMIQAMKKDEDDKLDEEADIMREMEMEEAGISMPAKPRVPEIQIEDSQAPMPLGPDRGLETEEDEDEEPELGPDGQPRRVWKKKGLKRQTRRVISKLKFTMNERAYTNDLQCDLILQNLSLSPHYKNKTTRRTSRTGWQTHKLLEMPQIIPTRTRIVLITQVTFRTRRRGVKYRRRRKGLKTNQRKGQ
jgi:hypothetical protein